MFSAKQIYSPLLRSLVHIRFARGRFYIGQGTGFVIGKQLFTNFHVYSGLPCDEVYLDFYVEGNGTRRIYQMPYRDWLSSDILDDYSPENKADFAIINLDRFPEDCIDEQNKLQLCDINYDVVPGEECVVIGFPNKDKPFFQKCIVSYVESRFNIIKYHIDTPVYPGNSGGPVVSLENGCVIGMITRREDFLDHNTREILKNIDPEKIPEKSEGISLDGVDVVPMLSNLAKAQAYLVKSYERLAMSNISYVFSSRNFFRE